MTAMDWISGIAGFLLTVWAGAVIIYLARKGE